MAVWLVARQKVRLPTGTLKPGEKVRYDALDRWPAKRASFVRLGLLEVREQRRRAIQSQEQEDLNGLE